MSLSDARIEIRNYIDNYRAGGPVQHRSTAFSLGLSQSDAIRTANTVRLYPTNPRDIASLSKQISGNTLDYSACNTYEHLSRNMANEKLLNWITPLMLGALVGLYEILHGLFYVLYGTPDQKRDYPLEIVLGLPIMIVCLGGHWVIRRITNDNTVNIWIIESILTGLIIYGFYRS